MNQKREKTSRQSVFFRDSFQEFLWTNYSLFTKISLSRRLGVLWSILTSLSFDFGFGFFFKRKWKKMKKPEFYRHDRKWWFKTCAALPVEAKLGLQSVGRRLSRCDAVRSKLKAPRSWFDRRLLGRRLCKWRKFKLELFLTRPKV